MKSPMFFRLNATLALLLTAQSLFTPPLFTHCAFAQDSGLVAQEAVSPTLVVLMSGRVSEENQTIHTRVSKFLSQKIGSTQFVIRTLNDSDLPTAGDPAEVPALIASWVSSLQTLEDTYYAGQFKNVIAMATTLIRRYDQIPAHHRFKNNLISHWLRLNSFKALSYRALGDSVAYASTLSHLIETAPYMEFTQDLYPDYFLADVEKIRSQLDNRKRFSLQIESTPSDAPVTVNDVAVGKTPLTLQLMVTRDIETYYHVGVYRESFTPYFVRVNGHFYDRQLVSAKLIPHQTDTLSAPESASIHLTDHHLPLDTIVLSDEEILPETIERSLKDVQFARESYPHQDLWYVQLSDSNTLKFCTLHALVSQWWCEHNQIQLSSFNTILPQLYGDYLTRNQGFEAHSRKAIQQSAENVSERVANLEYQSMMGTAQKTPSNFPWWLVAGGAVLLGSIALIATSSGSQSGDSSDVVTGTVVFP